jgi:ribonuclease G
MAKEMIVSVNGREKKIAILEDGKVTEFYIERGEENTGVVGNIYKGRVQRVLPGMQSAFVEIGLERDAFLYVSDFFDEEEEFERIVMEKTKKVDPQTAEKVASEKLQQARLEREQAMEALQERVEPLVEKKKESAKPAPAPVISEIEEIEDIDELSLEIITDIDEDEIADLELPTVSAEQVQALSPLAEDDDDDLASPFVGEASSFERIVDEDAETAGDLFKEARIQERLTDQVRAIEFEIEPTQNIQVGTLVLEADAGGAFERIADDEEAETSAPPQPAAEDKQTGKGGRSRRGGGRGGKKATAEAEAEPQPEAAAEPVETVEEQKSRKKDRGGKKAAARGEINKTERSKRDGRKNLNTQDANRADEAVESDSNTVRNAESTEAADVSGTDTEVAMQTELGNSGESSPSDAMTAGYADAEASVDDLGAFREEMAVRRGGRRRRGGRGGNRPPNGDETTNGAETETEAEGIETEESTEELTQEVSDNNGRSNNRNERGGRGERGNRNERTERGERNNDRGDRNERGERGDRSDRNERSERGGRDRRPPTITDLLREGQEILVQIAKEPIAKKGARITSHIALPGRFLVYMPTIEHVGVSRKIESSNERNRLRHVIQKIRNEEDVPSGGFIVRTAGIGVPEQDLRDDARYLVRTWLDIRKQAERSKSPALVHQDLDLVERILRDQLSDDFAAIRVDDEAEYLRTVEFINRIQPRMTNRVKLYTRDTPIMEAYGVQEEIDKAVKPRVWLKSGGYLVINQTEALVSIDVNTGKFVGKGATRLEDTITKTNMEAVEEIARQIRLRDLGGIIVLDLIDMEDRKNRQRVLQALQEALQGDKSPTKVLSFNDFGLIVMTRKRVKQSLERTLCSPCHYCQGAGLIKSAQTVCYEILAEARRLSKQMDDGIKQTTLRVHPEIARALRSTERDVLVEIEDYLGAVDLTADAAVHQEQYDFAFI